MSLRFAAPLGCALLALTAGCAGAVESSKLEDGARRAVPVAICLKPLERHGASGVVSTLQPEDYWSLILPSFDPASGSVDRSAPDCAGRLLLDRPELLQAEGARTGSISTKPEDAVVTAAPNGFRIVWLRTHRFADGTAAGPLALVRPKEGYAEVYATGLYRGNSKSSRFVLERMGPRIVITATDEGCAGVKPNEDCETSFAVFLMHAGRLAPAAHFPLDRIHYGAAPGVSGTVQYRLTATPVFHKQSIRVVEQVVVRDVNQGPIRKSDLERVFKLNERGNLIPTADSLWSQVLAGGAPSTATGGAATPGGPAATPGSKP
ncbi:MAG TPA: hypothetical protein VER33_01330 [Polyangiaceae bacterium]|nr:hypothetical protein [Polyangiaceae bacterium]